MEEIIQKIYNQHDVVCNQKYSEGLPYSFHLKAVYAQTRRFTDDPCILIAAAGHDLIEDARMTYNDVAQLIANNHGIVWAERAANIIYACTEEKGHDRLERHSDKFFNELAKNRAAVLVKLCDILANVFYSKLFGSRMFFKYQNEFPNLENQLYVKGEYDAVWAELKKELF